MKYYIYLFISLMIVLVSCKLEETTLVFVSGTDGHKSYRIPAIIGLPDGTLLAFAEGRVTGNNHEGEVRKGNGSCANTPGHAMQFSQGTYATGLCSMQGIRKAISEPGLQLSAMTEERAGAVYSSTTCSLIRYVKEVY